MANSSGLRVALACRIRGLACCHNVGEPTDALLSQRVMCSWLSAPCSNRDKPVAVIGPMELTK